MKFQSRFSVQQGSLTTQKLCFRRQRLLLVLLSAAGVVAGLLVWRLRG